MTVPLSRSVILVQMVFIPCDVRSLIAMDLFHCPISLRFIPNKSQAPKTIEDATAVKPAGWMDDAAFEIPDPEAVKPEDWDDEEVRGEDKIG